MDDANQNDANWEYTAGGQGYDGADIDGNPRNSGVPLPPLEPISWSASEYIQHHKSASWYLSLTSGGLVLVGLILLITRDLFASIAVLLALATLGIYAGRKPATKQFTISEQGVNVDDTLYQYDMFRSFSVVEEGGIDSIWLKPLKRFSPMVVMYFSPEDEQKIVDMLANFLPNEQRELDNIDKLSKRMRF